MFSSKSVTKLEALTVRIIVHAVCLTGLRKECGSACIVYGSLFSISKTFWTRIWILWFRMPHFAGNIYILIFEYFLTISNCIKVNVLFIQKHFLKGIEKTIDNFHNCSVILTPGSGSRNSNKYESIRTKKIYRLKEDQAFSLSLELGQREKVA